MQGDTLTEEERLLQPGASDAGDYSWIRPIAVDRTLLTPKATSRKMTAVLPKYVKKEVAVLILHEGEPFYTKEGLPYYNLQEETVFAGFKTEEINLPGDEIFNIDLTSSYLSEFDVPALRQLISLYSDLQMQILRGKDKLEDLYYIYSKIMGIVDTAKSRDGKTARLSKTTISEGTSKQEIIEAFKKEQQKKSWIPGRQ